jgi:hypothetical protein
VGLAAAWWAGQQKPAGRRLCESPGPFDDLPEVMAAARVGAPPLWVKVVERESPERAEIAEPLQASTPQRQQLLSSTRTGDQAPELGIAGRDVTT